MPPEEAVRCAVCKHGRTEPGTATVSIDRGGAVVIIRDVPADICDTCGEEYITADVMRKLEEAVEQAREGGLDVAVRRFAAA